MLRKSGSSKTRTTIVSSRIRSVSASREEGKKSACRRADGSDNKGQSCNSNKKESVPVKKSDTAVKSPQVRSTRRVRQVSVRESDSHECEERERERENVFWYVSAYVFLRLPVVGTAETVGSGSRGREGRM